jgi:uncharacterized protein YbjQ (UPF0145 family)
MHRALRILPIAALAAGCASQPALQPVAAEQVSVHQSVASAPVSFKVIKRYWVGSWASAFMVPTYASQDEAMQAFRQHAADLGGNGIINFGCYRKYDETSLGCNGTVVRFQ